MIFTRSQTTTTPSPRVLPTLEGIGPDAGSSCALVGTHADVKVAGFIAEVRVEQTYVNTHDRNLNTLYTFPLPHDAAVCAFEFTVDGKVVRGEVREKAEARAKYVQARDEGRHAGLLEEQRPNIFTLELANIPAKATVKAVVSYLEALPYRSGEFELRFPTVVAPKYTPVGGTPVPGLCEIETASRVAKHTFSIDIAIDAGMPIAGWSCATHALVGPGAQIPMGAQAPAGTSLQLKLAAGTDAPDRDLVLTYRVGGDGIKLGMVTYRPDAAQDGSFYLFAVPPADVASKDVRGKELIFLLDRSGSMSGAKMTQAREALKACLRALNPADAFAINAFDDRSDSFAATPQAFTQGTLEAAERWLDGVEARGGTEILAPLQGALAGAVDPARQRIVVLITDGQVSNESQLLAHVRQHLGAARLFTVGVDTAVNTYLLTKLATMGKGASQFVLPTGDIEGAISGLAQRFGSPLLTDPVADFGTVRVSDLTPHPLPDVMAGQVVVVAGRFRGAGKTEVSFAGQGPGRLLEHRVEVDFPKEDRSNPLVDKIWARLMIDRHETELLDDAASPTMKQKIVALAVKYGLVSTQTSFVAVDERDGDPMKAKAAIHETVTQQLPADWDASAYGAIGGSTGSYARPIMAQMSAPAGAASPRKQLSPSPAVLKDRAHTDRGNLSFGDLGSSGPLCAFEAGSSDDDLAVDELALDDVEDVLFCLAPPPPSAPAPKREKRSVLADREEAQTSPTDTLRALAKQQQADGSWNGSVEETARNLLKFVQAGHTDRTGSFTAQIRRAVEFLDRQLDAGYSGDRTSLLAAFAALATATGSAVHRALEARVHA